MNGEREVGAAGTGTARAKFIAHLPACKMPYAKSFPSERHVPITNSPCIHCDTLFYTFHSHQHVLIHEVDEPPKASVFQPERSGPPSHLYAHAALGQLKSTPCQLTAHHFAHSHRLNSAHPQQIVLTGIPFPINRPIMSLEFRHTTPEDVVGKVLRRAEVAKVRLLSDQLLPYLALETLG